MNTEDYRWHYDYVRLAWDAGFSFDKYKHPNLDKNKICLVDIDRIIKERDVASIERFLPIVVQFMLENDHTELLDVNFVKMFRMSQLSVEYLLFCKKYLDNTVVLLKNEIRKLKDEKNEIKIFTEELESHISTLTKQSFVTTFKCDKCPKAFSSEEYLNSHVKRRHHGDNKPSTNTETDQLQSEIKQLKERLNNTEKLLQEKDEKTQNVKVYSDENENKVKVNEILEKFENFKDKVENDLKMLQIEKNFYEEKYSKLFDVVFESNRKEKVNNDVLSVPESKSKEQRSENFPIGDKIETTTQTEEDKTSKTLQIETVHDRNVFEFQERDADEDNKQKVAGIHDTIEQKINQFEEQIELKICSSLNNIEKQMQTFWGKLSEIESKREAKQEFDQISARQEIVQVEAKPRIKPRMKLSKPTKYVNDDGENAKILKAEIEKMSVKPVKAIVENRPVEIPSVMYDSSQSSESKEKSVSESKTESESSVVEVLPKKVDRNKSSTSTLGKRSVKSLRKAAQSEEVTERLRDEINNIINNRLQDIGISPNWKGVPRKTFEKALEIVQHQASLAKKLYPDFDSIKRSIEMSIKSNNDVTRVTKRRKNVTKQSNVINIRYRKKLKNSELETESKSPVVTIKNRSLYNTDSEDVQHVKPFTKAPEAVPSYSAVIRELKESQAVNVDTDSDVNSIILPEEDGTNEVHAKSALRNYPSMGSLTKKRVLFDIESDKIEIHPTREENEKRNSVISIDSSDLIEEIDDVKKTKKSNSSLSDFDLSEL